MFNKDRRVEPQRAKAPAPRGGDLESRPSRSESARAATLGPSISIVGNLSGNEDLVIEGAVKGEVAVKDHLVTISETGRVEADVHGRSICVEGEVKGNLVGDEQVVIRRSGRVRGNVTAPRVNLENGAKFKGSIDMQPADSSAPEAGKAKDRAARRPEPRDGDVPASASSAKVAGETA